MHGAMLLHFIAVSFPAHICPGNETATTAVIAQYCTQVSLHEPKLEWRLGMRLTHNPEPHDPEPRDPEPHDPEPHDPEPHLDSWEVYVTTFLPPRR